MERSDKATIEKVLAGDVQAYSDIVGRYQAEIFKTVAYAMLDQQASEDLVQRTFVDAYYNLDKFDARRDFGAWLRTIARNLVRSELRRIGREKRRLARVS